MTGVLPAIGGLESIDQPKIIICDPDYFFAPFSRSFNALPALNLGTVAAGILIASPVAGFLPLRAALLESSSYYS